MSKKILRDGLNIFKLKMRDMKYLKYKFFKQSLYIYIYILNTQDRIPQYNFDQIKLKFWVYTRPDNV